MLPLRNQSRGERIRFGDMSNFPSQSTSVFFLCHALNLDLPFWEFFKRVYYMD